MKRKRPAIATTDLEEMVKSVDNKRGKYDSKVDTDWHKNDVMDSKDATRSKIFEKGLSKRIWEELYKVVDSSDVVVYVVDARNPNGTRTKSLEDYLRKNCPNKHLIFVLNKCDLIPTPCT